MSPHRRGSSEKEEILPALVLVNQLNDEYRWIKFVLNENYEVIVMMDAVLDTDSAGKEVKKLLDRAFTIIDEAYPEIMKARWA